MRFAGLAIGVAEAAHPAGAIVGVEVLARDLRNPATAVDESTDDRARALVVTVGERGLLQPRLVADRRLEARRAVHRAPPIIDARARSRRDVHFLVFILADVGDIQQTAHLVEGESPGIAETDRPDLSPS